MTATILDFVASLANTLAWPVVVTTLALIFKDEVAAILSALQQRIKHLRRATGPGNTSVEFDQVAEEADAAALELSAPPEPTQSDSESPQPRIDVELQPPYVFDHDRRKALSKQDPGAALVVSYGELDAQIRSLYSEVGLDDLTMKKNRDGRLPRRSTTYIAERLEREGFLPEGFIDVLRPVLAARSAIAHGQVPEVKDRAELRELVEHCATLASVVRRVRTRNERQQPVDRVSESGEHARPSTP